RTVDHPVLAPFPTRRSSDLGDLACVSFRDDGRGAGRISGSNAAGTVESAAKEISVECKWDVDQGRGGAGRELLGEAFAGDGAVWGEREGVVGGWPAGDSGGGTRERARGFGAAPRGTRSVWEFAGRAGAGIGPGADGEEPWADVGGRGESGLGW